MKWYLILTFLPLAMVGATTGFTGCTVAGYLMGLEIDSPRPDRDHPELG